MYARVPRAFAKHADKRSGTLESDPGYMAFAERRTGPAEKLPSAEMQLEERERLLAEGGGAAAELDEPALLQPVLAPPGAACMRAERPPHRHASAPQRAAD